MIKIVGIMIKIACIIKIMILKIKHTPVYQISFAGRVRMNVKQRKVADCI